MKKVIHVAFVAAIALVWGQVQFVRGFDTGADTSMCVFEAVETQAPVAQIEACQRVWLKDPSMVLLRGWRVVSGDAVK